MNSSYDRLRERFQQLSFDDPSIIESAIKSAAYAMNSGQTAALLQATCWILYCGHAPTALVIDCQRIPEIRIDTSELLERYCETIYALTAIKDIRFLCSNDVVWTVTRNQFWSMKHSIQHGGQIV